jgi:hypothetical protein
MNARLILAALLAPALALGANSPLESDFAEGYWDKDFYSYGRQNANFNISVAADNPGAARQKAEAVFKAAGGTPTNFSDMTATEHMMSDRAYGGQPRPAYSMGYLVPDARAASVARELSDLGRLVTYNTGTPYGVVPTKELEERIQWIEKEKARSAQALATMPVSRYMLDSKLKRLKAQLEQLRGNKGGTAVNVQILREVPAADRPAGQAKP